MQHLKNRRVKHISRPDIMFRCFSWAMAVDLYCAMKDFYSDQSVSIPVGKVLFLYLWGDLISFWGSNKNLNKVLDSIRLLERSSTLAILSLSKLQEFSQQKCGKSIYSYSLEESPPKCSPSDLHQQWCMTNCGICHVGSLTFPLQTERTHSMSCPVSSWNARHRFISWSHSFTAPPSLVLKRSILHYTDVSCMGYNKSHL